MAVIQKIRDKYAKLAGGVIAVSLVGFLLMDAGDNLKKIFTGSNYVAKVNGEKIDAKDYAVRINEYESLYELMGSKIDDNTRAQIHNQVLSEMIYEKLSQEQKDALGIVIAPDEEKEMFSATNPDPFVKQFPYFKNPETNQFDPQYLVQFEKKQLPNTPEAQKAMEQWAIFKSYIIRNKLVQKYNSLFTGAVYTPKFLLDRGMKDQFNVASISFVKIPYATINDADIKVSDAEIQDYLKKHEAQYKVTDVSRGMEYVAFDITPSASDTAASYETLVQIKPEFATTTDVESFVNRNSEEAYSGNFVTKKSFASPYADTILSQPVGTVYGPYFDNGFYKLTKVLAKQTLPDSVKVRHILVKTEDRGAPVLSDSIASKKIDSVKAALAGGVDFKELVTKYSDDQGSKATGGEYDFSLSQRAQLSKEFADFAFEGKAGEKKVVKVKNDAYAGYHYIEIISQKNMETASKLATVSKSLFASEETQNAAYAKAQEFAGRNTTAKAFDETAQKQGLNKLQAQSVKESDFTIQGVGSSREIIRWMYHAKIDDVSQVFSLDNRYIICKLSSIQEEGLPKIDASNRPMFEAVVKADKKAQKIMDKYKSMKTLDAIAQASSQPLMNADSFNAATTYFPVFGFEPKIVGYTFSESFKPGTVSPAIKGQDGVFYIMLKSRQQVPNQNADPNQMLQQQMMQNQQLKGNIASMKLESIRKSATIKYSVDNLY